MADEAVRPWRTIEETCKVYGVSRRTIYNWMAKGKLKDDQVRRTPGGSIRILVDAAWRQPSPPA